MRRGGSPSASVGSTDVAPASATSDTSELRGPRLLPVPSSALCHADGHCKACRARLALRPTRVRQRFAASAGRHHAAIDQAAMEHQDLVALARSVDSARCTAASAACARVGVRQRQPGHVEHDGAEVRHVERLELRQRRHAIVDAVRGIVGDEADRLRVAARRPRLPSRSRSRAACASPSGDGRRSARSGSARAGSGGAARRSEIVVVDLGHRHAAQVLVHLRVGAGAAAGHLDLGHR